MPVKPFDFASSMAFVRALRASMFAVRAVAASLSSVAVLFVLV